MNSPDIIFVELQKHLDRQAVGFPATKSGVEIRLLKHFFNPEEAALALNINIEPQSALDIFNKAGISGLTLEKVKSMLDAMESNGAIGATEREGTICYYTLPLLVGMLEWHANKATPEFGRDFGQYMGEAFGRTYASSRVSQMRTLPVEKSIRVEHYVTTYDRIRDVINSTEGPIGISSCMCRESAAKRGDPCHVTKRSETCMGFGDWARHFIKLGTSRQITREEALEIISKNQEDGLVLQPSNDLKIDYICSCCGCCCGLLKIQKSLPAPAKTWAHNYHVVVNSSECTGCGTCVSKCQVDAATIDEQKGTSVINLDRCIGCGNCVAACPSEALKLVVIENPVVPPADSTGLFRLLAER